MALMPFIYPLNEIAGKNDVSINVLVDASLIGIADTVVSLHKKALRLFLLPDFSIESFASRFAQEGGRATVTDCPFVLVEDKEALVVVNDEEYRPQFVFYAEDASFYFIGKSIFVDAVSCQKKYFIHMDL